LDKEGVGCGNGGKSGTKTHWSNLNNGHKKDAGDGHKHNSLDDAIDKMPFGTKGMGGKER